MKRGLLGVRWNQWNFYSVHVGSSEQQRIRIQSQSIQTRSDGFRPE